MFFFFPFKFQGPLLSDFVNVPLIIFFFFVRSFFWSRHRYFFFPWNWMLPSLLLFFLVFLSQIELFFSKSTCFAQTLFPSDSKKYVLSLFPVPLSKCWAWFGFRMTLKSCSLPLGFLSRRTRPLPFSICPLPDGADTLFFHCFFELVMTLLLAIMIFFFFPEFRRIGGFQQVYPALLPSARAEARWLFSFLSKLSRPLRKIPSFFLAWIDSFFFMLPPPPFHD